MFIVCILNTFTAQLPRHFVLVPASKSIYVLQGQSGEVTCEAEGPSVSTLKWEKQQDDKSYAAIPNSQVNITKNAYYVRATLKITNVYSLRTLVHTNAKSQFHQINRIIRRQI